MTVATDSFIGSLGRGEPPSGASPMLRAVWHGLHGDWDAAHEISQAATARPQSPSR